MTFKPLPALTVLKIIFLYKERRWGYKAIAHELNLHFQTCRNWVKKYEAVGEEL